MKTMLVMAAAAALAGCATVTRGTTNQVAFESNPPGAEMRTSSGSTCTTPCTLTFDRKTEFVAVFNKPGYEERQITVETKVASNGAAGFAGNILVGGVVGMVADAATGATLEHFPNPVIADLSPVVRHRTPARRGKRVPVTQAPAT